MSARVVRVHRPSTSSTPRTLADIDDAFDDLVGRACTGDRPALGAIAIAVSRTLLRAARLELGDFHRDAGDVLHDFYLAVADGRARFRREDGHARHWLTRIVREMARQHRAARERD